MHPYHQNIIVWNSWKMHKGMNTKLVHVNIIRCKTIIFAFSGITKAKFCDQTQQTKIDYYNRF